MAKLNICDLCKKPADTDHRLSLFKKSGKKHESKLLFEICSSCHGDILGALSSPPDRPIYLVQSGNVMRTPTQVIRTVQGPTATVEEAAPGVFKVKSNITLEAVKKANKELSNQCSHDKMTVDDDGRIICEKCKKLAED